MPQPRLWTETLHDGWGQTLRVDEVLFELDSGHQHLLIFRNAMFGTVLALDGVVQTTEKDEFIYHEMLTHVPIVSHGACRKVLIIGGGDGGILREVCRHPAVTSITQVEIDPAVIELSRKYLPNHSRGAFDDPRLTLVIDDGVRFVQECGERFDVIISDSTDPHGPAEALFTSPFYAGVKRCLEPDGIFVAQNGVAFVQTAEVLNTASRLRPLFEDVSFYTCAVPTYTGGIMTFAWASDDPAKRQVDLAEIVRRWDDTGIDSCYYTGELHQASFALPRYLLQQLD